MTDTRTLCIDCRNLGPRDADQMRVCKRSLKLRARGINVAFNYHPPISQPMHCPEFKRK